MEIERAVGNRAQAKRLYDLEQELPLSTLPELVAVDWLKRKSIPHLYQTGLLGGRQSRGGVVPDLVVLENGGPSVWQIQGNYWHQRAGAGVRDAAVRQLLLGSAVNGRQVQRVVEIWERRLLKNADDVLNSALMGIEEGP